MEQPTKSVLLGKKKFVISGVSHDDPYFNMVSDDFEPEFMSVIRNFVHEDYVCVDIGANIGLKSLLLSQYVPNGRVVAIEAAPKVGAVLEQNVARSGQDNVHVVKVAVGETNGTVNFTDNSAFGHISEHGVPVPIRRLASICQDIGLNRVDFIKIDAEGYEFPILKDALDIINEHGSLVFFEFNTWCQLGISDVNPREFIEWVLKNFKFVVRVRRGGRGDDIYEPVGRDEARTFLHTNLVHDQVVSDLLVTNNPERLEPSARVLRQRLAGVVAERDAAIAGRDKALAERDAASAERDRAVAERDSARAEREHAMAERERIALERDRAVAARDAALAEVAALHNSTSWRLTSPLRALSTAVRAR